MKNIILILTVLSCCLCVQAQSAKKTRNTAKNTEEAVTERKISNRFNKGLRDFYTAQYDDAMRDFSGILADAPKHAPSYFMISRIHTGKKQYSEAQNALKQAVKLDKNNIWYQVSLAENYMLTEDYKTAAPMWEKICIAMPDNETYLFRLYECYIQLDKSDKVVETLNKLERLTGPQDKITRQKVDIYLKDNNINAALNEYVRLIDLYPHDVSNYLKAGILCEQYNRDADALAYYEKAYRMFPTDPEVNMMLANYWILHHQEEKSLPYVAYLIPEKSLEIKAKMPFMHKQIEQMDDKNAAQVQQWAEQLVQAHPSEAASHASLGQVLLKRQQYAAAAQEFGKALAIDDAEVPVWEGFVTAVEKSQRWSDLTRLEESLTTMFPQSPDMLSALANAFLYTGNSEKAVEYYKQALAFSFDQAQKSEIRKGLHDAYTQLGDTENAARYGR